MKLFGFTRLSAKLLAILFLILGGALISLFTVIESREYFDARRNLVINLKELVTTQSASISTALWEVDEQKLIFFLSKVGNLSFIQGAVVTNASGIIIAKNGDIDTPAKSSEFVIQKPLFFGGKENPQVLGSIKIIAHDREIFRELKLKLINDALILFVLLAALIGATFFATNMVIGRPLILLQESIEKIRWDGVREPVDWYATDELGQVISAYNEMQSVQENAEDTLTHERDNLELRVKERTKKLACARDSAKAAQLTLNDAIDNISNGFILFDKKDKLVMFNKRFTELAPHIAERIKPGISFVKLIKGSDQPGQKSGSKKTVNRSNEMIITEHRNPTGQALIIQKDDGNWLKIREFRAGSGGRVGIWSDITESKAAEEERLRQSQKMEVLGQLTSSVAHDFNSVLTVLDCNMDLLKSRYSDQEQQQSLLENCFEAIELGSILSNRLTRFAKKKPLAKIKVDLNTLIVGFSDLLNRSVGKEISIEYVRPADTLPVLVDTTLLEVALLNLVLNARDSMPEGGKITVSLDKTNIDEAVDPVCGKHDKQRYALLKISDTGIGMAPEIKERVLEAFFTTKDDNKGTGLGLSTVNDMAQSAGGFVQIESELGQGTAVKIFLPLYEEEVS